MLKIIKANEYKPAFTPPPDLDSNAVSAPGSNSLAEEVVFEEEKHVQQNVETISELEIEDPAPAQVDSEEPYTTAAATNPNQLVSILKKKDNADLNSIANSSPVTFSESVVEGRPSQRSSRGQGILKKRSSLDESLYLQNHSGDESATIRRNSVGETRHGILKEPPSRDGSTGRQHTPDVAGTSEHHHGILKTTKLEDSPKSCDPPKNVSISQAVILAFAEMEDQDSEPDVRPILKSGSVTSETLSSDKMVRPILKKKNSLSETEESQIRPILKSSRKSSREEIDSLDTDLVRPCLKGEGGPSKCESSTESLALVIDRENCSVPETMDNTEGRVIEKPLISVAERIKDMESFLTQPRAQTKSVNGRRTLDKDRFKTQPITVDEFSRCVLR